MALFSHGIINKGTRREFRTQNILNVLEQEETLDDRILELGMTLEQRTEEWKGP